MQTESILKKVNKGKLKAMNIKMTEYMLFSKVNTPISRHVLISLKGIRHCNSATYLMMYQKKEYAYAKIQRCISEMKVVFIKINTFLRENKIQLKQYR